MTTEAVWQASFETHAELVERGVSWLTARGYPVVMAERGAWSGSITEIADVIGFHWSKGTVVIEVKTSRSDFHADRKKLGRKMPDYGLGQWRYYLCPVGLIAPGEVADPWGLLYVHPRQIRTAKRAQWQAVEPAALIAERNILVSHIFHRTVPK